MDVSFLDRLVVSVNKAFHAFCANVAHFRGVSVENLCSLLVGRKFLSACCRRLRAMLVFTC